MWFFNSKSRKQSANLISLVVHSDACKLGASLATKLPEVITVNATANESGFEADVSSEEDRNRLIAYLLESKSQIKTLVFNQPFMMEPS